MIDLHTHILPEVDDGAKNFEEALKRMKKLDLEIIDFISSCNSQCEDCEKK